MHLPAAFFYSIPPHLIYKSYPIYHPAKEPPGYMEWLKQQEPQIVFDPAKLTTESDWIAAGKLVFEAPLGYEPVDKFRSADWYQKLAVPLTADGIVPGRGYVIRKKGVVESAGFACANCHSRVLPDGTLCNGPQTNFPLERDFCVDRAHATKSRRRTQAHLWTVLPLMEPVRAGGRHLRKRSG